MLTPGSSCHDEVLELREPSELWDDLCPFLCGLVVAGGGWERGGCSGPAVLAVLPWLARLDRDQSRTSC